MHSRIALTCGRWWTAFPFASVAFNDVAAYFAGSAFGRHKLTSLSPKKTIEGFIGGFIANLIYTAKVTDIVLGNNQYWTCAPKRYTLPFENYQCETLSKVYIVQPHPLPFTLLGYDEVMISPALVYCLIYCLFAAFIAPFAGFFASGFKRAYNIKDFSTTLPGHGGIMDRFDCVAFTILFNYFLVTQVIFPDEYKVDEI